MTHLQVDNCLAFLDRAPITGHAERHAMNEIFAALVALKSPPDKAEAKPPKP